MYSVTEIVKQILNDISVKAPPERKPVPEIQIIRILFETTLTIHYLHTDMFH